MAGLVWCTACAPSVRMQVLEPATVSVSQDIEVIAVVDRSRTKNFGQGVLGALDEMDYDVVYLGECDLDPASEEFAESPEVQAWASAPSQPIDAGPGQIRVATLGPGGLSEVEASPTPLVVLTTLPDEEVKDYLPGIERIEPQ